MFWSRLRQSRHRVYAFSNEFKRSHHLTSGPIVNQYISPRTIVPVLNNPKFIVQDRQWEFFHQARFYGKRIKVILLLNHTFLFWVCVGKFMGQPIKFGNVFQPLKKEKEEDQLEPRVNEQITAPWIRLVTEEGACRNNLIFDVLNTFWM